MLYMFNSHTHTIGSVSLENPMYDLRAKFGSQQCVFICEGMCVCMYDCLRVSMLKITQISRFLEK